MMNQPTFRDVEQISAYLDGQLSQVDVTRLETRLKTDTQLQMIFAEMRQTRVLLRELPARRAPRNFTLTPKMAGLKPPLPRTFPIFQFASVLATVLFFCAYMANLSAPVVAVLRAAAPAPVMGIGGGGGDGNSTALESAPAAELPAAQSAADAAVTATPELRVFAPLPATEAPAPTEMAFTAAPQAKLNPGAQNQAPVLPALEPVQLPISPFLLFGLLGFAVLSGGSAYLLRLRTELSWFKEHSLPLGKVGKRQIAALVLGTLILVALAFSIYWLSSTVFYAPASANQFFPVGLGDKGPVSGGDKGGPAIPGAQGFTLTPGLGYNFSVVDEAGLTISIDFPQDVFSAEMVVSYIPGLNVTTSGIAYPTFTSFSLVPAENGAQPQVPFTISLDYNADVASSVDENKLALYWWSGSDWQDAAATCNPASDYEHLVDMHRLRITVCQMGSFVLVAP